MGWACFSGTGQRARAAVHAARARVDRAFLLLAEPIFMAIHTRGAAGRDSMTTALRCSTSANTRRPCSMRRHARLCPSLAPGHGAVRGFCWRGARDLRPGAAFHLFAAPICAHARPLRSFSLKALTLPIARLRRTSSPAAGLGSVCRHLCRLDLIMAALYPACRWFANVKRRRHDCG